MYSWEFALKRILKLPEPFSGHCLAINSEKLSQSLLQVSYTSQPSDLDAKFFHIFYYYLLTNVSCYTEDCVIYRGSIKGRSTVLISHITTLKRLRVKCPLYKSLFCTPGLASHARQTFVRPHLWGSNAWGSHKNISVGATCTPDFRLAYK